MFFVLRLSILLIFASVSQQGTHAISICDSIETLVDLSIRLKLTASKAGLTCWCQMTAVTESEFTVEAFKMSNDSDSDSCGHVLTVYDDKEVRKSCLNSRKELLGGFKASQVVVAFSRTTSTAKILSTKISTKEEAKLNITCNKGHPLPLPTAGTVFIPTEYSSITSAIHDLKSTESIIQSTTDLTVVSPTKSFDSTEDNTLTTVEVAGPISELTREITPAIYSFSQTFAFQKTEDPSTPPSIIPTTQEPTTLLSTLPTTQEPTTLPSTLQPTQEPTTLPSTLPTTQKPTTFPLTLPSTQKSTTLLSTLPTTQEPTTLPSTLPTTQKPTTFPLTLPSTQKSTTLLSTLPTTQEPTTLSSTLPTTQEPTTLSSTLQQTQEPTTLPSTRPTTQESTTLLSTQPTTEKPATHISTHPTTSPSTHPSTQKSTAYSKISKPSTSASGYSTSFVPRTSPNTISYEITGYETTLYFTPTTTEEKDISFAFTTSTDKLSTQHVINLTSRSFIDSTDLPRSESTGSVAQSSTKIIGSPTSPSFVSPKTSTSSGTSPSDMKEGKVARAIADDVDIIVGVSVGSLITVMLTTVGGIYVGKRWKRRQRQKTEEMNMQFNKELESMPDLNVSVVNSPRHINEAFA